MLLLKFAFYLISLVLKPLSAIIYDCQQLNSSISAEPYYVFSNSSFLALKLKNFDSFNELRINCLESLRNIFIIEVIPKKKQVLDNSLNLAGLNLDFSQYSNFYLANLNGIDLKTSSKFGLAEHSMFSSIEVGYSYIKFYSNKSLFMETNCHKYYAGLSFFTHISSLTLGKNNIYNTRISPLMFKNSMLASILIEAISNSFINKNVFKFVEINETLCRNSLKLGKNVQFNIKNRPILTKKFSGIF